MKQLPLHRLHHLNRHYSLELDRVAPLNEDHATATAQRRLRAFASELRSLLEQNRTAEAMRLVLRSQSS